MQPDGGAAKEREGEESGSGSGSGSDREGELAGRRGRGRGGAGSGASEAVARSAGVEEGRAWPVRHGAGDYEGRSAGRGIGGLGGGGGGGGVGGGSALEGVELPRPVVVQDESVRKRNRKMLGALLFGTLQVGGRVCRKDMVSASLRTGGDEHGVVSLMGVPFPWGLTQLYHVAQSACHTQSLTNSFACTHNHSFTCTPVCS